MLHNLHRGCDPVELLEILCQKGFVPAKNPHLMQLISARESMEHLLLREPHLKVLENGRQLPPEWLRWAEVRRLSSHCCFLLNSSIAFCVAHKQENMRRGLNGTVLMEVLVLHGFEPKKNPHLAQMFRKNRGGSLLNPLDRKPFGYLEAVAADELHEVRRYIAGGQQVDERFNFKGRRVRALEIAIDIGSLVMVEFLIDRCKANIKEADEYGRTALHHTAAFAYLDKGER